MKKLICIFVCMVLMATAETVALKDGVYKGQANGYKGPVHVEVTVNNGLISKIEVTRCSDKFLRRVEKEMNRRIVEANSTKVDVVSGATITSRAVQRAVRQALTPESN